MKRTLSFERLYSLCNKHQWFTSGSCKQYDKLFDLNNEGATLDELALVIWICSDDKWSREDIRVELHLAKREELSL